MTTTTNVAEPEAPGAARAAAGWRPHPALAVGVALAVTLMALAAGQLSGLGDDWIFSWPLPLLTAIFVLASARAAGAELLRALALSGPDRTGEPLVALPAGLSVYAVTALVLGLSGALSREALLAVCIASWSGQVVRAIASSGRACIAEVSGEALRRLDAAARVAAKRPDVWIPLAPFPLLFVWASLPPTFYDAVVYHLGLPNLYLHSGAIVWPERFSIAAYPQYAEMINLYPLALGGETAVALSVFLLSGAAALSLRSLIEARCGRWPAALGTLFVVSQWPFWFQAAFLKNDLLAALLLLTSIRLLASLRSRPRARPVALAGVLSGVALGTKWLAGLPVALIALWLAPRGKSGWRATLLFIAFAGLLATPWLARNLEHFGNPVYPALHSIFGGDRAGEVVGAMASATGTDIARDPASMAKRVLGIGHAGGYGSGGEASRLLLPVLALGLLLARPGTERRLLSVGLLTLLLGLGLVSAYLRLFFLSMLLSGLAVAIVLRRPRRRWLRLSAALVVLVVCAQGIATSVRLCERLTDGGSDVALGRRGVGEHLSRLVNYAPLGPRIDERLPPDARLLVVGSSRTAYLPRAAEASYAWDEPLLLTAYRTGVSHRALTRSLVDRGFSHVLLNGFDLQLVERSDGRFGFSDRPELASWMNGWFASLDLIDGRNEAYLFALRSGGAEVAARAR